MTLCYNCMIDTRRMDWKCPYIVTVNLRSMFSSVDSLFYRNFFVNYLCLAS